MLQFAEYTAKSKCCSVLLRYKVLFVNKLTLLQSHFLFLLFQKERQYNAKWYAQLILKALCVFIFNLSHIKI